MKLVADESVDRQIVDQLRKEGRAVHYIAELEAGLSDKAVLELANKEAAVLLTADKDFGDMVFRQRLHAHGVVLVRLSGVSAEQKGALVARALNQYADALAGGFAVISAGSIRIRRLV